MLEPNRLFPKRHQSTLPCYMGDQLIQGDMRPAGLYFIKIHKCASTTSATIATNIARRHALKRNESICRVTKNGFFFKNDRNACKVAFAHNHASEIPYLKKRSKSKTLLWTFIRDPTSRFISWFYHVEVSREGKSERELVSQAKIARSDFMYEFTQLDRRTRIRHYDRESLNMSHRLNVTNEMIQAVLDQYDFIGLTERFHESSVVMKILWGLDFGNLLYMNSKRSGSESDSFDNKCVKLRKSNVSSTEQLYFQSSHWKSKVKGDEMFHAAVNRSLDLTINRVIGKKFFDVQLSAYENLLKRAQDHCMPSTIFPCDKSKNITRRLRRIDHRPSFKKVANHHKFDVGTNSTEEKIQMDTDMYGPCKPCYLRDIGCGFKCLDDFYARESF
uniref:Sulfotransferase domain-containing protein n=1 Tax=Proboscia inermis TaxID=420281 RepID=A0A7S0GKQ3_9STRA